MPSTLVRETREGKYTPSEISRGENHVDDTLRGVPDWHIARWDYRRVCPCRGNSSCLSMRHFLEESSLRNIKR